MGFRYQDKNGQTQVAADLRALHQALKQGDLAPDTPVLDESVNVRLKAAALIAFKAREAANAAGAGGAAAPSQPSASPAAANPPAKDSSMRPPAANNMGAAPRAPARPAQAAKRGSDGSWVGKTLIAGAVLSFVGLVAAGAFYAIERGERQEVAREDMKSMAKTARDAAKEIEKDLPEADKGSADGKDKPLAKVPAAGKDLLAVIIPLVRQSQLVMVQNSARHQQEMEQLNLGQVMAPETLLSRDGIARNNLRIKAFRTSLERLEQAENERMKKLVADVHAALANHLGSAGFAEGFEDGLSRSRKNQDEFIRIQYDLAALFQRVTDFMASRQGSASVRGDVMVFAADADVNAYQQFMKDLDRLAAEEAAVQRKMVEAMKRSANQMEEWSK